MGKTSLKERMRIGPKGQVVLPAAFRRATGMVPGSSVLIELTDQGILIEKQEERTEDIFQEIARAGRAPPLTPHGSYESQIRKRHRKFL
ncbi:MAG: AbrB/MazE/SpoVT family DNA-binding domain-containing protein [Candidatus Aenigmarchaeota archaeon]|nr:AbrB/MazE/SpoVT family DNA-binding domain-containing protein [Candidatus Aenigmarchaeota archaeon]